MASLGPALLFLLIGSLVPFGGIVDDVAPASPTLEASAQSRQATVQAPQGSSVSVDAVSLQVAVETQDASVTASPSQLQARVAETTLRVDPTIGELFSTELPVTLPGAEAEEPGTSPGAELATQGAEQVTATPESAASTSQAVGMQVASAAAIAAVVVAQSDPGMLALRRWLRFAPLAGLYSRISPNEMLDHETRQAIYDLLTAEPGLSLGTIAERLDLSRSTARHHVHKLEEGDLIRHRIEGRCRIHYPVGHEQEAVTEHVLRNESRARIAELLETRPLSLMELSGILEANPGAVHFHLGKLQEAGLVERHENGSVKYRRSRPT